MKRYNMNLTCKGLFNRMSKGEINFDCSVQRGLVWDNEKKSLLIHSLLYGYAVPAFYMVKNDEGGFDSLDGKQRSNAIYSFMAGEYVLTDDFPPVYDDDSNTEDFAGMSWDNLPEWAQDRIKDYSLTIYYFEDMSEEEIREFFRRLNNGKPLSAVELTRVKALSITDFQDLAKHEAVQYVVTDKGRARFVDENLVMQIYGMAYMEHPDFGTKAFRPYIQEVIVSSEQKEAIRKGLDYIYNCMVDLEGDDNNAKILRKIKMRTHFVAMAYYGMLCAKNGKSQGDFNKKVHDFYNTSNNKATVSPTYNDTIGAGSAKAEAVQRRKSVIDNMA